MILLLSAGVVAGSLFLPRALHGAQAFTAMVTGCLVLMISMYLLLVSWLRDAAERIERVLARTIDFSREQSGALQKKQLSAAPHRAGDEIDALDRAFSAMMEIVRTKESALMLFRTMVDQSNDAFFVVEAATGRVLTVNERACKNLGYGRDELVGAPLAMISAELTDDAAWKKFAAMVAVEQNIVRESIHRRKDGSTFPVEVSIRRVEGDGRPYHIAVARDITNRRRAEEALRESMQRLNAAQKVAHIGSWELDLNEQRLVWSDEIYRIFEIDPARTEASYETFLGAVHPDDRDMVNDLYLRSVRERAPYDVVHRLRMQDGRVKFVREIGETSYDETGTPIKSFGTIQDVTRQQRAEEQLVASLREKEMLLKEIHHRVKNNLQIIASLLFLQSEKAADPETLVLLGESRDRIKSMAIVHEKLYGAASLSQIDLHSYVESLTAYLFHAYGADQRNIKRTIEVGEVALGIDMAISCGLILNELIVNAIKHAFPEGNGTIDILARKNGMEQVELTVRDNGTGLAPGVCVERAASLGFRLIHKLTQQLHGRIETRSDRGAVFSIVFPLKAGESGGIVHGA